MDKIEKILQKFRVSFQSRKYLGLGRINRILDKLDNPENKYVSVHVAGTNGKGSVCAMLHNLFSSYGYKTGLFTSPHLERFTERIKVDNNEISEEDFIRIYTEKVLPTLKDIDTEKFGTAIEFEIITAVAFYYFMEQNVDIVILEVGLGGRFDSTNAVKNVLASIITSISFDHTDRLGNTLKQITEEKAGIIKANIPVITTANNPNHEIYSEKTNLINFAHPELFDIEKTILDTSKNICRFGYELRCNDKSLIFYNQKIFLPLLGKHQLENLSIFLKTLDVLYKNKAEIKSSKENIFSLTQDKFINYVIESLNKTKWAGRIEAFCHDDVTIILDGAHNANGMEVFTNTLKDICKNKKVITIFACSKDKEYKKMLDLLSTITDHFILTTSHVAVKAQNLENLSEYLTNLDKQFDTVMDYNTTLQYANKIITDNNYNRKDVIINICGTLYLVGALRTLILKEYY